MGSKSSAVGKKRKYTTITIPAALFEKVERKIKDTGFSSVSDYVTFILRETIAELELSKTKKGERGAVMEKLKALGYVG